MSALADKARSVVEGPGGLQAYAQVYALLAIADALYDIGAALRSVSVGEGEREQAETGAE